MSKLKIVLLATILGCSNVSFAQVYVSTSGSDLSLTGSVTDPYRTISHAVQVAMPSAVVYVAPGTYFETVETYINKPLTLQRDGTGDVI